MLFTLSPGEHIDYTLFGCFPAAIERDILIACAPRSVRTSPSSYSSQTEPCPELQRVSGSVVAENLHGKYSRQTFVPARKLSVAGTSGAKDIPEDDVHVEEWHLDIDTKQLRWESYVKAGYYVGGFFPVPVITCSTQHMTTQGVLNHYFTPAAGPDGHPVPVDLLVTGSVPAGSGLSSSAAMVVASTLAFLAVNGKLDDTNISAQGMTKGKLVEMAMENEKRVGKWRT
jgi:galactokinase